MIQRQISPRTTETKAPEHQWDDQSSGDSRIEILTLTKDQKALHIAFKKETVADDTANSHTSITSRVSQTTLSDVSKNLEELSPIKKEEAIDDQTRSMDSHEIQCEKEYEIDLRADTGTLFFPDKIVMEQHSLTPSQPWCKVQESIKGLNDIHSEFEMKQENVTDTHQCVISTIRSQT